MGSRYATSHLRTTFRLEMTVHLTNISPLAFSLLHVTHLMSVDAQSIFDMFPYFGVVSTTLPRNQQPARGQNQWLPFKWNFLSGCPMFRGKPLVSGLGRCQLLQPSIKISHASKRRKLAGMARKPAFLGPGVGNGANSKGKMVFSFGGQCWCFYLLKHPTNHRLNVEKNLRLKF